MIDTLPRTVAALATAALVAIAGTISSGCVPKHAPRLPQPVVRVPSSWQQPVPVGPETPPAWWTVFGDAQLSGLVERALEVNGDLHVALQRIEQARAAWRAMRTQREPVVRQVYQTQAQRTAIQSTPAEIDVERVNARLAAGVDVAYEVDLWKRRDALTRAAAADVEAAAADAAAVRLMVSAEVARQYVTLAQLARQERTLDETRGIAEARRAAIDRQRAAGLVTVEASLAIARELDALRASAVQVDEQSRRARKQIAILLGLPPAEHTIAALPALWTLDPPVVPVGLPARVLASRPDVLAAETRAIAGGLRTRAAVRAAFPELTLTGAFGVASDALMRIVTRGAVEWSAGAQVSAPLFARGRIRAGIEAAQADEGVAVAQYRVAVLGALGEVEAALARVDVARRHEDILRDVVSSRQVSEARSSARMSAGLDSRLDALDARAATLSALDALDRARAERLIAAIDLLRALGAGYVPPPGVPLRTIGPV